MSVGTFCGCVSVCVCVCARVSVHNRDRHLCIHSWASIYMCAIQGNLVIRYKVMQKQEKTLQHKRQRIEHKSKQIE